MSWQLSTLGLQQAVLATILGTFPLLVSWNFTESQCVFVDHMIAFKMAGDILRDIGAFRQLDYAIAEPDPAYQSRDRTCIDLIYWYDYTLWNDTSIDHHGITTEILPMELGYQHGGWWPGDTRSLVNSSHGIDHVKKISICTRKDFIYLRHLYDEKMHYVPSK